MAFNCNPAIFTDWAIKAFKTIPGSKVGNYERLVETSVLRSSTLKHMTGYN
jgi:hypothetical protein